MKMDTPVLKGWKEIAAYLKVDPKTARKLESIHGLPVTKHERVVLSTIYALEKWIILTMRD